MFLETKREGEVEAKADPFDLRTLIAWLEGFPADERYCYSSNEQCLLSQYFTYVGYRHVFMFPDGFVHSVPNVRINRDEVGDLPFVSLPQHFNDVATEGRKTFGWALQRARKVLTQHGP